MTRRSKVHCEVCKWRASTGNLLFVRNLKEVIATAAARAAGLTLRTHREQALHRALEQCIPTIRAEMVAAITYTHFNFYLVKGLNSENIII